MSLNGHGKSVVDPLVNLLPFLIFFPSIFYWCTYSEVAFIMHPIITVSWNSFAESVINSVQYVFINMVFVELIVHLMLMHICHGKLTPFDKMVRCLLWVIFLINILLGTICHGHLSSIYHFQARQC